MATCHLRSIGLPSRSHPLSSSIEEQLKNLRTSESSVSYRLSGLKELYECIDDFLQLQLSQRTVSNDEQSCVEEVLDVCDTARDSFSQVKESLQKLESSLRRRGGDSSLTNEVDAYMVSRKTMNKVICTNLKNLKRQEKKCRAATLCGNSDFTNMISMIKSAEEISLRLFESSLSFISQPITKSKPSGRSIISNKLQAKRVSCEGKAEVNEVEKIDVELVALKTSKDINSLQVQNVLKGLESLESSLQQTEQKRSWSVFIGDL